MAGSRFSITGFTAVALLLAAAGAVPVPQARPDDAAESAVVFVYPEN